MVVGTPTSPSGARTALRVVGVPFTLGFVASALGWAVWSTRCCAGTSCGAQGFTHSVIVVAVAMPMAGFVTSVLVGTGHRILGFISVAVGVTIPIVWAVMIECPPGDGDLTGKLSVVTSFWPFSKATVNTPIDALVSFGAGALFLLAIGYFAHWVVRTQWKPEEP